MKITSLKVNNFKSLHQVTVSGFSNCNFIHGFNNSGKSNFLKFLELLFSRKTIVSPEEYVDDFGNLRVRNKVVAYNPFWDGYIYDMPFLFSNNNRSNNITFEVSLDLLNSEVPHSAELLTAEYLYSNRDITQIVIAGEIVTLNQSDSQIILREVKLKGHKIYSNTGGAPVFFEEPANSPLNGQEEKFRDVMDIFNDCVMLIESERYFSREKLLQDSPEIFNTSNFKNWLYNVNLDADKFDKFSNLIAFFNGFNITSKVEGVLDDNLKSFPLKDTKLSFARFKEEIEIMLENPVGRFPLKNYGTGIQQILFILSKVFDTPSKVVLIEELELNLSPEYQELIINNLQEFISGGKISQVFFTSHSDYLNRNDFKIYEVKIDGGGKSSITPSTYTALNSLRRNFMKLASEEKETA